MVVAELLDAAILFSPAIAQDLAKLRLLIDVTAYSVVARSHTPAYDRNVGPRSSPMARTSQLDNMNSSALTLMATRCRKQVPTDCQRRRKSLDQGYVSDVCLLRLQLVSRFLPRQHRQPLSDFVRFAQGFVEVYDSLDGLARSAR